ncbi:MAG: DUF2066 domain-containing protein [Chromatiales bacterium]|jgi:hypothetical protein|nr:DUF2066 domain-containing protein [Chromatiales bacterium]
MLVCVLAFTGGARAGEVADLYQAEVPVRGQTEAERGAALAKALEAVLVKVTGERSIASSPGVADALRQPMAYVQQYLYLPLPAPQAAAEANAPPYTQLMRVRFDAQAISRLQQQTGLPMWGKERPTTLIWIAVDDAGERYLLSADDERGLREQIASDASRRGVPVLLPLLDLEDQSALLFSDVWGNFAENVQRASVRYQVPGVAVGRLLHERGGMWSVRWSLYHDGEIEQWTLPASSPAAAITAGIDGIADFLAAHYARAESPEGGQYADIAVAGVSGLADYERTMGYLAHLDQIRALQVLAVEGDNVRFRARLGGDARGLARTIAFGKTLALNAASSDVAGSVGEIPQLSYRLLP